ncbi:MAG: tyrosine-type recombinase/integrase [Synergistaceae bacterium]|jgi:integrase|nr:tyrosine-type recombinase/integrase [Synergistaceae bacterium]
MALIELVIKQARPREKSYTLSDGKGLLLEIFPNGRKRWVVRYWVGGREKRTSLGTYPDISLKAARDRNYEFRRDIAAGTANKPAETFADVAKEWMDTRMKPMYTARHIEAVDMRLNKYILPALGTLPLSSITSGTVLQACREIEREGHIETARRVKIVVGQIFRYAIATDRIGYDPTYGLKNALQTRKEKHHPTITEPDKIALLTRQINGYPYTVVRCALKFSMLTFCRPGEIRAAEWKEIDREKAQWNIPEERMKMRRPHIVPLVPQTLAVLDELRPLTGEQKWLFPSARGDGRCMSENTVRIALRSMGYGNGDIVPHGFRSMASTILNENGFPPDIIEKQLAHAEKNAIRAAYNHAEYLPKRREMMEWWANWLDDLN